MASNMIEQAAPMLDMILRILEKNMDRSRSIKDPVTRFTLLVDKLCLSIDVIMSILESGHSKIPDDPKYKDLKSRMDKVGLNINKDLNDLMSWIQQPVYSPDHPLGSDLMEKSKAHFENVV